MDGAQFAKMLSDKHLLELNRMEYKYSTVSVKEFAELLRQNFAQPLPLTDFSEIAVYLPNLAQISTNGMKQLLSVPVSGQNFGLSAMTEEIYATFQIESIRSTRSSIRYILDGYAPRDEQEARIYGMKRGLEFIANRQNTITEENPGITYIRSARDYAARAVILKKTSRLKVNSGGTFVFYCKGWFLFFCGQASARTKQSTRTALRPRRWGEQAAADGRRSATILAFSQGSAPGDYALSRRFCFDLDKIILHHYLKKFTARRKIKKDY